MYEKTYITKPIISPQYDSERFLVCSNFVFSDYNDYFMIFERTLEKIQQKKEDETITNFLSNTHIPLFFKTKMEECNVIIGQQQLENIHKSIFDDENVQIYETLEISHIKKCITWCNKHDIAHNQIEFVDDSSKNNIFRQPNI